MEAITATDAAFGECAVLLLNRDERWDGPTLRPRPRPTGQTQAVLLVDAANVVGSRPTGWWRDRAGAARTFVDQLRAAVAAERIPQPVYVVLEGRARLGATAGTADGVTVVHADGSGDDTLVAVVAQAADQTITLVTADRALRRRAQALGADVVGPGWLLDRLVP